MSEDAASLATPRLILRRWREADRQPFAAINADPRVGEFLLGPLPRAMSDSLIERYEAQFERDGISLWAVERCEDARLIGIAGLQPVPFETHFTPAVEIGWHFAPEAWGHGYATEAAAAAREHAVALKGLGEVVSFTVPGNLRSQRVMQRLGFKRDLAGDFNHPRLPPQHPHSLHWLYRWCPT